MRYKQAYEKKMTKILHRFRSTDNLLDKNHELENQEIYFASPDELNDPMEGFKDVYWHGDEVAWKNLAKHYLLCLEHVCSLFIIGGKSFLIQPEHIPVFKTQEQLPTPQYKQLFEEICNEFFDNDLISQFIKGLSNRSSVIRRSELLSYFSSLHLYALEKVFAVYEQHRFIDKRSDTELIRQMVEKALSQLPTIVKLTNEVEESHPEITRGADLLYSAMAHTTSQLALITRYNGAPLDDDNKSFIFLAFPETYIRCIEKILYPDWYAACFMNQHSNSSVWGNYADKHRGACLSFKSEMENDRAFIKLYGIYGWGSSGPMRGKRNHEFYKIDYEQKPAEVDFFRSLGRLPRPVLMTSWYTDKNGSKSVCADEVFEFEEQWRERYWARFYQGITTKLKDWAYEEEYRLILSSSLIDFTDPNSRKLKYDFSDLESITFGINTSTEDKLKIMKIIEAKCKNENRKEFKFYQAHYYWQTGTIERSELSLLRFA
jgi:hypothetical protein